MYSFSRNVIVIILLLANYIVVGQYLDLESGMNISNMQGDELLSEWSPDGSQLLFQSNIDGKNTIYIYNQTIDTTIFFSSSELNFRNAVWHPDGDKVVFDSDYSGRDFLYVINIGTHEITKLFNRNIACKNATYSSSDRQVYFTGFDELNAKWEIYSYDFVYDNLNKLTNTKFGVGNPDINAKGKLIAISKTDPFTNKNSFELINWYGDRYAMFNELDGEMSSWDPMGLKLYFITNNIDGSSDLYSIWKDGSHIEKIASHESGLSGPSVSPDGTKIALSVKTINGWDVFVLPFDDY